MNRALKIAIIVLMGLITLTVACVILLNYFDWNRAKPILNDRIAGTLGRPFSINGDLTLDWSREGTETDWRRQIPWPHLVAHDVIIGNPDWVGKTDGDDNFVTVKKIMFSVNPLALMELKIVIPALVLETPNVSLRRSLDGKNNWTFDFGRGPSLWKLELNRLVVSNGTMQLDDALRKLKLSGRVETLDDGGAEGYGLAWKVNGSFNGAELDGNGKAGAMLSLQTQTAPYPLNADIHAGKTHIRIKGTLTKPSDLAALDLRLSLAGASMAELYPLTGIAMPETPPYETEGHLIGQLNKQGSNWHYEKFKGKVGSSDLSGSLEYQSKQLPARPRALLTGSMVSNQLLFQDLAPIIGADSKASKVRRDASAVQAPDKVLPTQQFKFERWHGIDADVQFTGRKIVRDKNLPLDDLLAHIYLRDGVLSLLPLEFGVAGGKLVSSIKLDGNDSLIKAELNASARHIKLRKLAPDFKPMQSSFGEINGDAKLSATGNSVAGLLGASNGEVKTLVSQGTVSKLLLDEAGLNVLNILLTKLFGDKQVTLNCVAGDFTVTNGLMQTNNFLIDTDETAIDVKGQIDLANEHLALIVKPENKKFRWVSLRTPIYVGGSFKNPTVSVDKGVVAMRAGGAVALGVLTPFAAMLPLVDVGPGKESECAKLLQEVQTRPQAPPPGKTYRAKAGSKANPH
jgi:uncharacterized protein involved in outer membrane biogenesis